MLASAIITLYLAFNGGNATGSSSDVTVAILAILAQAGAACVFAYSRRFDPRYAASALAHLATLVKRAGEGVRSTQEIIEQKVPNQEVILDRLRIANIEFSYIRESAIDASDDWLRVLDAPLRGTAPNSIWWAQAKDGKSCE